MTRRSTATISLNLTYDAWKDLEGALLQRAIDVAHHEAMRDRLNAIRHDIEKQVKDQHPRW